MTDESEGPGDCRFARDQSAKMYVAESAVDAIKQQFIGFPIRGHIYVDQIGKLVGCGC